MTDWKRVSEKCEDEETKASSSRSGRVGRMKYPGEDLAKLRDEQDEFRAKEIAFREIGRICRVMALDAIEDRIKSIRNTPPLDSDIHDQTAYRDRHWPKAYDYALRQCGLAHLG